MPPPPPAVGAFPFGGQAGLPQMTPGFAAQVASNPGGGPAVSPGAAGPPVMGVQQQVGLVAGAAAVPRQPAQFLRASVAVNLPPLLWTLECTQAEVANFGSLPREQRSLIHRQEPGGPLLPTLRVGRLFQDDLFNLVVKDEETRGAVSREHFQIWADQMELLGPVAVPAVVGIPCAFFLTNYSVNGTVINGTHLYSRGEQVPLHSGDSIALARIVPVSEGGATLVPFLEFRFDLAGSCLCDAEIDAVSANMPQVGPATEMAVQKLSMQHIAARPDAVSLALETTGGGSNGYGEVSPTPYFALEVGGEAVRIGIHSQHRRIVHGPATLQEPCPALLLGRAHQQGFWNRLLIDEAFNALSRQHLQIDVLEALSTAGTSVTFSVRNFSERNPIRVVGSLDDVGVDATRPLEPDQPFALNHGDVIWLNTSRGSTLWLVFLDLMVGRSLPLLSQAHF